MTRLHYNGISGTLGGSLSNSATSVPFASALTHSGGANVPTISGGDYLPLSILDSGGNLSEIVYLTAYTSGATTGTITRGRESTSGVSHSAGDRITHATTATDIMTDAQVQTLAGALDDASALRQAFGSRLGQPISPWRPSPTLYAEMWTLANMQATYNTTEIAPLVTANGSTQSPGKRTRIPLYAGTGGSSADTASGDLTFRIEFDFDLSTISGGWADIQLLLTDNTGTLIPGTQAQMVVTNGSPKKTGHYVLDFKPPALANAYLELRIDAFNNAASGTIGVSNVSLKRTGEVSRPMLVSKESSGGNYPLVYWQQRNKQTDVWKVVELSWAADGDLAFAYRNILAYYTDAPWSDDPADPAFTRTTASSSAAVNNQSISGIVPNVPLRSQNNDQILEVWNGSAFEYRGNVHNGEFVRGAGATWKADTGAGFVPWTVAHGLDPVRRFQVDLPTEIRRSTDGTTPFCNVDHKFTLFPDGMIRCDRTTTFLADTEVRQYFEWMSSHETTVPWVGRIGRGTDPTAEVDIHAKLATPATAAPATATTGGTLAAGTYSYRVAALSAQGETLAYAPVTQVTTGSASTVTVNWSAVSGAIGYAVYGRTAGFERLLFLAAAGATSWIDTGAVVAQTTRPPQSVSSARTGTVGNTNSVAYDNETSSDTTWSAIYEPLTGWCFGQIYDREAALSRTGVTGVRTRLESASGLVKNYMNLAWAGSTLTIPSGTVYTATHWAMAYLPFDVADFHREVAIRAANISALADLYPII